MNSHCLYCEMVEFDGMYVSRELYHQLSEEKYSSGYPAEHVHCRVLACYEMMDFDDKEASSLLEELAKDDKQEQRRNVKIGDTFKMFDKVKLK